MAGFFRVWSKLYSLSNNWLFLETKNRLHEVRSKIHSLQLQINLIWQIPLNHTLVTKLITFTEL